MTTWYVAPDNTTVPGVTLVPLASAVSGTYARSFSAAAKWSEFNGGAGSVWGAKFSTGDTIVFLGGTYLLSALSGGWSTLHTNYASLTISGQSVTLRPLTAVFIGSRTSPWPLNGDVSAGNPTGGTIGETFMNAQPGHGVTTFNNIRMKNVGFWFQPASNGNVPDLGTVNFVDCSSQNSAGALCYTNSKTDGRINVNLTRTTAHGYSRGAVRVWGAITADTVVTDSEFQSTAAGRNNAQSTGGLNSKDAIPGYTSSTTPMDVKNFIGRNHAAGISGGGYSQGDSIIGEENVGMFTGYKILTYGSGDRGVDLKCTGKAQFVFSWGDGTAGVSHHMDTQYYVGYHHLLKAGKRTPGASNPCVCAQTSGKLLLQQSALIVKPTAAQIANNAYAVTTANVDIPKIGAGGGYGAMHQGLMNLVDCWAVYDATSGATEQNGYAGQGFGTAYGLATIFGLSANTTRHFAVRAHAQDGSSGPISTPVVFTTDTGTGGDLTGPTVAPANFAAPTVTANTITFNWDQIASDSGAEIQGYFLQMSTDGGTTWVTVQPAKTNGPLTLSGFKPSTSYQWRIAAYDATDNVGVFSSAITVVTPSGSTDTSTPSVPTVDGATVNSTLSSAVSIGGTSFTTTPSLGRIGTYVLDPNTASEEVVNVTALSGSNNTVNTISSPLTKAHASAAVVGSFYLGTYTPRPTAASLQWGTPATGTVAYYEVVDTDNSNAVVTRIFSIPLSGTQPVLTKVNARMTTI